MAALHTYVLHIKTNPICWIMHICNTFSIAVSMALHLHMMFISYKKST